MLEGCWHVLHLVIFRWGFTNDPLSDPTNHTYIKFKPKSFVFGALLTTDLQILERTSWWPELRGSRINFAE